MASLQQFHSITSLFYLNVDNNFALLIRMLVEQTSDRTCLEKGLGYLSQCATVTSSHDFLKVVQLMKYFGEVMLVKRLGDGMPA
jgi:hypothetical protein